jgi:hypothetical protein
MNTAFVETARVLANTGRDTRPDITAGRHVPPPVRRRAYGSRLPPG